MNILSINSFRLTNPLRPNNTNTQRISAPKFGLTMAAPLSKDTVSFGDAPSKMLKGRGNGINLATAKKIYEITDEMQPEIENFIRGLFIGHMGTLIEYIGGRAKKPKSIVEKSEVLGVRNMSEAFHTITDLNATKAVMVNGAREYTHRVLDIILDAVKRGTIILEEVEVKRPGAAKKLKSNEKSKWDYADPKKLDEFVANAEEIMGKKVRYNIDYTPANYTALHFLIRFPGQKRVFEFQLNDHNCAVFKDFDDILFKILNNKEVDPKFKPIVDILNTIRLSKDEKNILKYLKIKEKLEKLKFSEPELNTLKSRVDNPNKITNKNDSPEFAAKIKSLLNSKDIDETDLSLLNDNIQYEADSMDKNTIKSLKLKAERQEKFKAYRAASFLFQREKKSNNINPEGIEYFLPLTEDLPPEFDLNHLYKIYLEQKRNTPPKSGKKAKKSAKTV